MSAPAIVISAKDRVYLSDQSSNTVSVVDPFTEKLAGVIKLGDQTPGNLAPLYKGQLLVHDMGFLPDDKTLDVVSIDSNSGTFIDTATNKVRHTTVGADRKLTQCGRGRLLGLVYVLNPRLSGYSIGLR